MTWKMGCSAHVAHLQVTPNWAELETSWKVGQGFTMTWIMWKKHLKLSVRHSVKQVQMHRVCTLNLSYCGAQNWPSGSFAIAPTHPGARHLSSSQPFAVKETSAWHMDGQKCPCASAMFPTPCLKALTWVTATEARQFPQVWQSSEAVPLNPILPDSARVSALMQPHPPWGKHLHCHFLIEHPVTALV